MLNKVTINFLCYLFSGFLVLITISANVSAAPRRPVYSSSDNNDSSSKPESQESIENRLDRLERLMESQSLVDLLVRIDNIQVELQSMRGDIEVINHSIDEIKRRQRDLYIDVDRRLVQLERAGKGSSVSSDGAGKITTQSNAIMAALGSKSTSGTSTESTAEEQKQYQQAFNLLRELRYDKSIKAFNKFIETYPKGRYAHIAQYWVGEANYAQRNFKQAIEAYQSLISNYPKSPKVAESLLKIGYSYYELNEITKAKSNLNKLVKLYPDTTEASQAKNKLQKIKLNSSKK